MRFSMVVLIALWIGSSGAIAQSPATNTQAAQDFFAKGNTAYNLGNFDEAADLFSKAYQAWPQPEFLYNIAQSYRLGGNCKQALHFYKRFRSLASLGQKKKDEVEKFISELTECVAKADRSADAQPDTIVKPEPMSPGPATATTPPETAAPMATAAPNGTKKHATALEPEDDEGEDDAVTKVQPSAGPHLVVARLTGGVALIGIGDLDIPVQPVVGIIGGYPLRLAPVILELGAALSYAPLPYTVMDAQKRGTLLGVRATAVVSYPIMPRLSVRGELGLGIASLSGLEAGNPISTDYEAGSFLLPSLRFGVAVDYELAPNIAVTVSPLSLSFSPGADGMYGGSLREIDAVIGIGYRQ
ncbi:MAG TPA: hypothetical protein VNO30_42690 [Kofleriaceae bacterium]|nr:hypothetical protein [Kofleriaceae bacterium]